MSGFEAQPWIRRLARLGAVLAALPGQGGYGVYASMDRRRRPVARLSQVEFQTALEAGWLKAAGEGRYRLSEARGETKPEAGETPCGGPVLSRQSLPDPEGGMRVQTVNLTTLNGPLARYAQARNGQPALLEPVHLTAADMLMHDYESSSLSSRVTQSWSGVPGGARSAPRDRSEAPLNRLKAQERVMAALSDVGPGLDHWLVDILIRQQAMATTERRLNWPSRSGAQALKLALDRLAIHYRLKGGPRAATPF